MSDPHAGGNAVETPLNSSTSQGVDNFIKQNPRDANNKLAAADTALAGAQTRITNRIADESKKQAQLAEARAANLIRPVKVPIPTLPSMSSITPAVNSVFKDVHTPDTDKLNQALGAATPVRSLAALDQFKKKRSAQVAAKSTAKISELIGLLATVNSLRNMLQKKKA